MRQEKDRQKRRAEQGECELCKRSLRGRIARCGQCAAAEEEEARRRRDEAAELAEERQRELEERMAEVDAELTRCSRAERAMKRAKELAAEGERAEGRARELNDEATRLARENAKRREGIERARRSVSLEVSERQEAMLPEGIRGQAMALRARNEAACEAMARTLRSIHLALPLRADSGRRGGPSGARACGLRVPMPNDFTGVPNHEAATALGYLLISLRLLSVALDSPVVHDGGFQGSTSFAWLPATVATPLPLHMHQPPMEGRLDRASPCPPPRSLQASTSRAAAYRRGVSLLHRSAAQLLASQAKWADNRKRGQSAVGALADACAQLACDPYGAACEMTRSMTLDPLAVELNISLPGNADSPRSRPSSVSRSSSSPSP